MIHKIVVVKKSLQFIDTQDILQFCHCLLFLTWIDLVKAQCNLMNQFSKDMDINVLPKLDQDEPVTKTESATAIADIFRLKIVTIKY